jgi:uncharacterized protein YoxC
MEQQIPMALQVALYAASIAIIVLTTILIVVLLQFRKQVERVARTVEELKSELNPLVQETRVVMERLRDLSGRVHERWMEVERVMESARTWSQRVNHLVEGIGSVVLPSVVAASLNVLFLRKGLETFARALLTPKQQHQQKVRAL